LNVWQNIQERGALPILCGGSGLYVESVIRNYNLSPVPKNDALRNELQSKSMTELTEIFNAFEEIE
jgi:tRNA dimethylallyltransferase